MDHYCTVRDSTLDEETIDAAMELAQESHDANIGFNWAFLQATIGELKTSDPD
ncbi:hypothetical protein ABSP78_004648 [Salmonella enterica subsp. enterica serovar 1,4,[5],12:i:-]